MYENTPQWHHSFFDKCKFWERTLNLLASQIFYCDILKPLALLLLWKMEDVCVLKSVFFFIFWLRDLPHMVTRMTHWLAGSHIIHTHQYTWGSIFKFAEFALGACSQIFNLLNIVEHFCSRGWSIPMKSFVHMEELCSGSKIPHVYRPLVLGDKGNWESAEVKKF